MTLSFTGDNVSAWNSGVGLDALHGDYFDIFSSPTWKLTGSAPNSPYSLYLYNARWAGQDGDGTIIITVDTDGNGSLSDNSPGTITGAGALVTGMTSASGEILGKIAPAGNDSPWAGFQLSATIPEPSTVVLMAMGAISLLAYAWRKRKCVPS